MTYLEFFKEELNSESTSFFILDTAGPATRGDIDFKEYLWETNRFNKVKEGDLFIYRR